VEWPPGLGLKAVRIMPEHPIMIIKRIIHDLKKLLDFNFVSSKSLLNKLIVGMYQPWRGYSNEIWHEFVSLGRRHA
jgi:hypothetical protein